MRLAPAILVFALACLVQIRVAYDPVAHLLVQMPLLAVAGALLPVRWRVPAAWCGPVLIGAIVTCAVWMLPRSMDAALQSWGWHLAKFMTLPLCLGLPLAVTWGRIGPVLRGFLKAQSVSMLLFLSFLYTHAPTRICNSYLIDAQVRLGVAFAVFAAALSLWWIIPAFRGCGPTSNQERDHGLSNLRQQFRANRASQT